MPPSPKPAILHSAALIGVEASLVSVETTMRGSGGTPRVTGSVDAVVREAYHRVLHAFQACELPAPRGVPLIHFGPADVRKDGSGFDLPMALSMAIAGGLVTGRPRLAAFAEVALDGTLHPCPGIVSVALCCRRSGIDTLLCAPSDAELAAAVPDLRCLAARTLREAVHALDQPNECESVRPRSARTALRHRRALRGGLTLSALRGLETPKRALCAAIAGRHDLLFVGPPGCGKSAMLRAAEDLLTEPDESESLDILRIHSARDGGSQELGVSTKGRPVRAPHCSSSAASVLGGGPQVRPGEVTLAHRGLLILDELPEFRREVLEGLRQPLEERQVTVSRARRTVTFPADFQLLAAMNPCPCGQLGSTSMFCRCTPSARTRYRARLSGPLLDRFDLRVAVEAVPPEELGTAQENAPDPIEDRILPAVRAQRERNQNGAPNGRLEGEALMAVLGDPAEIDRTMRRAVAAFGLSARGRLRVLRVARTLADLELRSEVSESDLLDAARLRTALED
ncbi:MAG: YifB family Mg chelatase-like AAA ATPase [Planctomycetota bacterium]